VAMAVANLSLSEAIPSSIYLKNNSFLTQSSSENIATKDLPICENSVINGDSSGIQYSLTDTIVSDIESEKELNLST
ncbi:hypothetical protein, partial [Campylobacter jejuni]|uniref:hypothetical protein n=1 Tax=Campylobacter jejuni TaxID=197 RepID=UPI001BFD76AE